MMNLTTTVRSGSTFVEIEGQVDSTTAPEFERLLREEITQGHRRLVLDFSLVTFISSMALRALLLLENEAQKVGGELRLFGVAQRVQHVLEVAGFLPMIKVFPTYEEAIEGWE